MCTKDIINASAWATDMGYAIALKITDINFPDLVQIHLFVFCQSGPPKPTRPLTLKASAHSFKQFTSRLLKLSFSLSMHIYNSNGRHA